MTLHAHKLTRAQSHTHVHARHVFQTNIISSSHLHSSFYFLLPKFTKTVRRRILFFLLFTWCFFFSTFFGFFAPEESWEKSFFLAVTDDRLDLWVEYINRPWNFRLSCINGDRVWWTRPVTYTGCAYRYNKYSGIYIYSIPVYIEWVLVRFWTCSFRSLLCDCKT